jgi:hypothetical protein
MYPASSSKHVSCATRRQTPLNEASMYRLSMYVRLWMLYPSGRNESARLGLCEAQPLHSSAMDEIGVVEHGHNLEQRIQSRQ